MSVAKIKSGSLRDRLHALTRPRVRKLDVKLQTETEDGTIETEVIKVCVREMTGADRDLVQQWINETPEGLAAARSEARMASIFLCDEDGTRIYESDNPAHIDELNQMPITFIRSVNQTGNRISGLSGEAVEEAKANFPATPNDDSTSDSPATLAA